MALPYEPAGDSPTEQALIRPPRCRVAAPAAPFRADRNAGGQNRTRTRIGALLRVLPDHRHHFTAVCDRGSVSTEIAAVGNEGFLGLALLLGGETTPRMALVQNTGWVYRIKGSILKEEFDRGDSIQRLLFRYIQALLTLIGQTAVCNRRHTIDQQLCRWLLLNLDRLATAQLTMTHELLANLMGVRREGITESARKLQLAGLITYSRGLITVIDRAGIEACCCECYGVVRREYDRLIGPGTSATQHASPAGNGRGCPQSGYPSSARHQPAKRVNGALPPTLRPTRPARGSGFSKRAADSPQMRLRGFERGRNASANYFGSLLDANYFGSLLDAVYFGSLLDAVYFGSLLEI